MIGYVWLLQTEKTENAALEGGEIVRQRTEKPYWTLFTSTFLLSAATFGGGYVIIPLLKRKFVDELHWIDEQEMLDMVAIAQSSPGPLAVNAAIIIGYRVAGIPGALVTVLGTVLPPLIIISVISAFYAAFRDNRIVSLVLKGMQAGVAAVIANVVINMAAGVLRQKRVLPVCVMLGTFAASALLGVNVVLCILACAVIGMADTLIRNHNAEKGGADA